MNLDLCSVWLAELVAVEVDEKGADVVDEFIDPREVEEGAVDGLGTRLVAVAKAHARAWGVSLNLPQR